MSNEKDEQLLPVPTQESFLKQLGEFDSDYDAYIQSLPEETRKKALRSLASTTHGLHTIAPMHCVGPERCPFVQICPIPTRKANGDLDYGPASHYPIGRQCLYERLFMQQKIAEYVQYLNIDPGNPIEMSQVNDLAIIDLYKNRASLVLSKGDKSGQGIDFMRIDITGYSETGQAQENSKVHPAFEAMEKLEKRRRTILQDLLETRKEKANLAAKMGVSQESSKMLRDIGEIRDLLDKFNNQKDMIHLEELENGLKLDD